MSGPVDVLARYEAERASELAALQSLIQANEVSQYEKELTDLTEHHRDAVEARAAVAELQRVAIFVSGRIFRWRTEGSAPSHREWMETEEMLDTAIARVGGAA